MGLQVSGLRASVAGPRRVTELAAQDMQLHIDLVNTSIRPSHGNRMEHSDSTNPNLQLCRVAVERPPTSTPKP